MPFWMKANLCSSTFLNLSPGWVSVKDVALAHIRALEVPSANGRYLLVERVAHYSEIVELLRKLYPGTPLPSECADDKPFVTTYKVSREKLTELGVTYTPLEEAIKETVESLIEKGMLRLEHK